MLPSLKDKKLFLTVKDENCYWFSGTATGYEMGGCSLNDLEQQITELNKDSKKKFTSIDVVVDSTHCRFATIPALKDWPEQDVLAFLIHQKFQQVDINFDPNNFIILNDSLKFNQPCVVVAFQKAVYEKIIKIQSILKVKSLMPSILAIWNYYESQLNQSSLVIIEDSFVYSVIYEYGIIHEINAFPSHLKDVLNYDHIFNFLENEYSEIDSNILNFKIPLSIQIPSGVINNQFLNFMRFKNYG
ncbi:hypothetical protein [Acinetobacter calcoaceticus]|uniref:hypothetical protein n=1 Tax=Acinetobacter calcoaceticus TaxID=471 RepID=UPI000316FFE8|nr:hypothetical protein [Acinetobacter calcoaceticus]KJH64681.1 hypothetical protein UF12_01930 [Acinetobacter calcoaceticus]